MFFVHQYIAVAAVIGNQQATGEEGPSSASGIVLLP